MDASRFDRITKRLSAEASRRRILRDLTGGALAGLGLALGIGRAEAKGKPCTVEADCRGPCRVCIEGFCRYRCTDELNPALAACPQVCDANEDVCVAACDGGCCVADGCGACP